MQACRMTGEHGWKLRPGRFSEQGRIYIVTACCFGRTRLFSNSSNATIACEELSKSYPDLSCRSLAFVVMPEHIHWLLQLTSQSSLGTVVGRMKGRSAYRINRRHQTILKVWQAGYRDHALRSDEDIEPVGQYLIHNPVRAGIVRDADEYRYWGSVWHKRGLGRG